MSVVIPSFNGKMFLAQCLPSVVKAAGRFPAGEVETIVVDDGSTDGTAQWCRGAWPDVTVLALPENRGFAAAANSGAGHSKGDWICLLNNDTVVDEHWIENAALARRDGRTAAIVSRILRADSGAIDSAGDGYTVAGIAYQRLNGREEDASSGSAGRVFSACAAAAFYRREALAQTGGFDESFESYYEDVDLGFRLNLLGWKTIYEPGSICRHLSGGTYGRRSWRSVRNSSRNLEVVFFSCMPGRLLLRHLASHVAADILQAGLRAGQGTLLPFVVGKFLFLKSVPGVLARRKSVQAVRRISDRELEQLMKRAWFDTLVLEKHAFFVSKSRQSGRRAPADTSHALRESPAMPGLLRNVLP